MRLTGHTDPDAGVRGGVGKGEKGALVMAEESLVVGVLVR